MKLDREDFKYNFLRRVILRIDYQGIVEIRDSIKEIQDIAAKYGFEELIKGFTEHDEFRSNDPNFIGNDFSSNLEEMENLETFKFYTADENLTMEINSMFAMLTINTKSYMKFEEYEKMFTTIVTIIRNNNPFLKPIRIGLRKINNCIIKNQKSLNTYFKESFYRDLTKKIELRQDRASTIYSECKDTMKINKYYFNYARILTDTILSTRGADKSAYQITLDVDGYDNNIKELSSIFNDENSLSSKFNEINEILFQLYISALSDKFINELASENFVFTKILGVKQNGGS